MTRNDYDDKPLSVFFTLIGILGIPPALFGLYTAGLFTLGILESIVDGQSPSLGALPACLAFVSIMSSGFWLLLQYIRRARGKDASVPPTTLWQLSTVQNTLYTLSALAIFIVMLEDLPRMAWEGVLSTTLPVLWFSFLTALSASGIPDANE